MATQVQLRRGTTVQHSTFTGAVAEVTYDTDKKTLVVHDGSTAGGYEVAITGGAGSFTTGAFSSDVTISGNLTVSGTTTTVNTETINLADNIITLNSNETGTPSENAGIEVERGTSTNVAFRWNETTDTWEATEDGTNYYNVLLSDDIGVSVQGYDADTAKLDVAQSWSADQTFGDNTKAIFGAGSDLQIYHDGSGSYVSDTGTGPLRLQGSGVRIVGTGGENLLIANEGNEVTLLHNNSAKLATTATGIDVTGTVTADGLTVDNGVARLTTSYLAFSGQVSTPSEGAAIYRPVADSVAVSTNNNQRLLVGSNGDISFYEDTGTTPKFFWDAQTQNISLTSNEWDVSGSTGEAQIRIVTAASDAGIELNAGNSQPWYIYNEVNDLKIRQDGADYITVDTSGNVGIGVTPEDWLAGNNVLQIGSAGKFGGSTNTSFVDMLANAYYDSVNSRWEYVNSDFASRYAQIDATHQWHTAASGTANAELTWSEAMRIDSSGNLLIATTTEASDDVGHALLSDGAVYHTADGRYVGLFNRKTSNGEIVQFRKDNSVVGSIGVEGGDSIYIGNGDAGLKFSGNADIIQPFNPSGVSARDDAIDLGSSGARFKDGHFAGTLYAARGVGATWTGSLSSNALLNYSAYTNWVITMTGNLTLTNPTTELVGQSGFIIFKQDSTGGRTVSLGSEYLTAGGAGITLSTSANAIDMVPYVVIASGQILLGTPQLAFA